MPTLFDMIGPLTEEQERKKNALQLAGTLGAAGVAIPFGTILPFQNYLNDESKRKIEINTAKEIFPKAHPSIFDRALSFETVIPEDQRVINQRVFNKQVGNDILNSKLFHPEFLPSQPGEPSSELGSFQRFLQQEPNTAENSIQAITVTPGPSPSRFSDASLKNVDELGKILTQNQQVQKNWFADKGPAPLPETTEKISDLRRQYVPQGGYVWGNIQKPQYDYAERIDPSTGELKQTGNPSLYISKFEASPSKQADYLYTGDVENDARILLKQFEKEGKSTGPSWGIRGDSSRAGRADADVNFRRDLIESRGELTTGDLQSLLKQKSLPFDYQSSTLERSSSNVLNSNLSRLAKAEGLTPYQIIENYARQVPALGEPTTPATPAVVSKVSQFPAEGMAMGPSGSFASKTDLRQIGILPPSDKALYKAFTVGSVDDFFKQSDKKRLLNQKYSVPYGSRTFSPLVTPIEGDIFGEVDLNVNDLFISRDRLRPLAANKLLNKTVNNLIEQAKPNKSLGLGGLAAGGIATAMDPAVIDALSRGDYTQAGTTAGINTAIGSAVGGVTAKGLQALQALGYARPAAAIASSLPLAGGVLSGLALGETGKAINRAYKQNTGKDWADRNKPKDYDLYTGSTPTIQPRIGTAILGGKPIEVPYGSIAGQKTVGRPWWDKAGSQIEKFANLLNSGSVIGR